jgi:hypothetical protein
VFWAGAVTPWAARFFGRPLGTRELLEVIHANRLEWLWIAGCFAVGVLLMFAGFVLLNATLQEAGERTFGALGQAGLSVATAVWLVAMVFRATAVVSAAREADALGAVPAWYEALRGFGGGLVAVYMVLAYLALAAYGRALLLSGVAPRWLGRAHVLFGLVAVIGYLARIPVFFPPLLVPVLPGLLGMSLLRASLRRAGAPKLV